jgi:hypothetical protein
LCFSGGCYQRDRVTQEIAGADRGRALDSQSLQAERGRRCRLFRPAFVRCATLTPAWLHLTANLSARCRHSDAVGIQRRISPICGRKRLAGSAPLSPNQLNHPSYTCTNHSSHAAINTLLDSGIYVNNKYHFLWNAKCTRAVIYITYDFLLARYHRSRCRLRSATQMAVLSRSAGRASETRANILREPALRRDAQRSGTSSSACLGRSSPLGA